MNFYIGIDVGTSSLKSVLYNSLGEEVISYAKEYNFTSPKNEYAEQDPKLWIDACYETLTRIALKHPENDIKGLSLSGQMHGLVLLDKDDNVLRPCILWCDNRTSKEASLIDEVMGNDRIKEITGNDIVLSFTLAKLLWVKNNEPEIYNRIAKVLLPKDYVRYILTKQFNIEVTDASGMQMLDIKTRKFSKEIINAFDFKEEWFPTVIESCDIVGPLADEVKELTKLQDITVVGGGADQACGGIGMGVLNSLDLSLVLGSSGVLFSCVDSFSADESKLQYFCYSKPNSIFKMAVTNGAGNSLKWYKNSICKYDAKQANLMNRDVYSYILKEASISKAGANGLIYLPYILGERTPNLDPHATGIFFGIQATTSKEDFTRAVIEGISFSLYDCYKEFNEEKDNIYISGGGSKSLLWRQILASMFNKNVIRLDASEGPAFGAAVISMVALGEYSSFEEAKKAMFKIKDKTEPIASWHEIYMKMYPIYKELYQCNKNLFKEYRKVINDELF